MTSTRETEGEVVEILKAAKERISDPKRWTQGGCYAESAEGKWEDDYAAGDRWCVIGSVLAELAETGGTFGPYRKPLEDAADELFGARRGLAEWNDNEATHGDVLALYDRAIELATKEANDAH